MSNVLVNRLPFCPASKKFHVFIVILPACVAVDNAIIAKIKFAYLIVVE